MFGTEKETPILLQDEDVNHDQYMDAEIQQSQVFN